MVKPVDTKLADLKKGQWTLIRSQHSLTPDENGVIWQSHYLVKVGTNDVTVMSLFASPSSKLETVQDWFDIAAPEVMYIHNNIFSYNTELLKYSLSTMTVRDLHSSEIYQNEIIYELLLNRKVAKIALPLYYEMKAYVKRYVMSEEEMLKAITEALEGVDS